MYGMTDRPTEGTADRPPTRRGPTDFGRQRASLPFSLSYLVSFLPSCLRYLPYLVELLINAGAAADDDDGSELTAAAAAGWHLPFSPEGVLAEGLILVPPSLLQFLIRQLCQTDLTYN